MCAYLRRNAGAVIHTHSKMTVMATLLWAGKEVKLTHLEMIKGTRIKNCINYYKYDNNILIFYLIHETSIRNLNFKNHMREIEVLIREKYS